MQRLRLLGEVFANILSRRKSEIEAQRLRRDLTHVGRVSTMGELTASLAHELNQPLTAILSNAEAAQDLLESNPANIGEIREILADIVEDDKRAGEVIHRLRRLLKKESLDLSSLDLGETLSEVARLVSADAALRNVSIRLELADGLPAVTRRPRATPASDAELGPERAGSHAGDGRRRPDPRPPDGHGASRRRPGRGRRLGRGHREAHFDHIFDAFYTTKPDGLGMGLAIARSIVEALGGQLTARNNSDSGSTFSFTLPIGERPE